MNHAESMTIKVSENIAEKLSNMAQESHNSLNEVLLKSIYLMEIAIKNKQNGNRLAIINSNGKTIDEISGI